MNNPEFPCPEFVQVSPFQALEGESKKYSLYAAQELGSSPDTMGCLLISTFAAALNGARCLVSKNYSVPSNLYMAVAAPPSSGKTPAKKRVVQNLIDLIKQDVLLSPDEERIRKAKLSIVEKSIKKTVNKSYDALDKKSIDIHAAKLAELIKTQEDLKEIISPMMGDMSIPSFVKELYIRKGRGICIDDEGAFLSKLETVSPDSLTPLLSAWSCAPIEDITKKNQFRVEEPYVVMCALWQVEPMQRLYSNPQYQGNGLLARILLHSEADWRPVNGYGCVPDASEQWYSNRLRRIFENIGKFKSKADDPHLFRLSDGAYQVFNRFKAHVNSLQGVGMMFHDFQDIAGKLDQQAVKLSMPLYVMSSDSFENSIIDETTMLRGCRLALYFAYSAINFLGYGYRKKFIKEAKPAIASIVQNQLQFGLSAFINVEDIRRINGYSKSKFEKLLFWMVNQNWLCRQTLMRDLPSGGKENFEAWYPVIDFRMIN
jgi:hypothetical protein